MATSFKSLVDSVVVTTNRPDLLEEIELAVRQSILKYHHLDFFWRDKVTGTINVSTGANARHAIELSTFQDMRAAVMVRPYFPRNEQCGKPLTRMTKLGECECEWWMMTPTQLIIRSATPTHQFEFTYYRNPILQPVASFHSWVADIYPDAVVDAACARVFEMMREQATADRYNARVGRRQEAGQPASGHCAVIIGEQLEPEIRSY